MRFSFPYVTFVQKRLYFYTGDMAGLFNFFFLYRRSASKELAGFRVLLALSLISISISQGKALSLSSGSEIINGNPAEKSNTSLYPFHIPDGLKNNVQFWIQVYSRYSTDEVVIHDSRRLDIVFEVVKIAGRTDGSGNGYRKKSVEKEMENIKKQYKDILRSIHLKRRDGKKLSEKEERVAGMYRHVKGVKKFLSASKRVRAQPGMRERFLDGVKRSGLYMEKIKEIFRGYGLPVELTVLPHVESSFNYKAYSSVGAAGIWQFMRSTGREYMSVDYSLDERRDPIVSTDAAARMLKRNYEELGNWPMAIIAYNHGLAGMKRAKRRMGKEVVSIINGYKSRLFGFASRNFYSEFLAALMITKNIPRYFGEIHIDSPLSFETLPLENFISIDTLSEHLDVDKKVIKKFNPALRPPVLKSEKLVPEGYVLKLPVNRNKQYYAERLASIPERLLKKRQIRSDWYRVRPGDNLSTISRRFKTTIASLMAMNRIRSAKRIYAGQVLKIPPKNHPATENFKKETLVAQVKVFAKKTKKEVVKLFRPSSVFSPSTVSAETLGYLQIQAAPAETLGHYSEWSGVQIASLRKFNRMGRRSPLTIGQKIKIPGSRITMKEFEGKRTEYYMTLEEDFFLNYRVDSKEGLIVSSGDTVWGICVENRIPVWLLKRFNPDKNLQKLRAGDSISVPRVVKIN